MHVARRTLLPVVVIALLSTPAYAATDTTTTGRVNDRTMEQFGGYTFKGPTRPSDKGDIVVFHFKRPSAEHWRPFKVGSADGSNALFVLNRERPRDRINDKHRWKILFTTDAKPGRWVLRAKFLRQGGLAASAASERVRVRESD